MNDNDIIEIIDDVGNTNSSQQSSEEAQIIDIEKKVSDVKYDPIEPEKETIEIIDDVEPEKNKSGLVLIIVLFILLIAFIILLPKINEIFGTLF